MGDTLATLVEEVQYETSQVVSPAVGQNFREHIKNRIRREYRRLYHDFNWRHLREWVDIDLSAGQRYYDYPPGIQLETLIGVYVYWSGQYHPIQDSLGVCDYNELNSDDGVRSDPVQKWRPHGASQIEVWPIPASNTPHLRCVTKRAFTQLTDEDDVCDLDTDLVVLFSAAQLLRRSNQEEAGLVLARAVDHYNTLKLRSQASTPKINFAEGAPRRTMGFSDKTLVGIDRQT